MLYFANPSTPSIRNAISEYKLGAISTPAQGNILDPKWIWCADNGCFGKGYPGDSGYLAWLDEMSPAVATCKFATVPDVVGDAEATAVRFEKLHAGVSASGFIPALVAQDGLENLSVPWGSFGALFLGGSTEWKLGEHARELTAEAKRRSKWVHMGRVNSYKRLRYAAEIGCDSADGTYLIFGPDINLPKLLRWLRRVHEQPQLW